MSGFSMAGLLGMWDIFLLLGGGYIFCWGWGDGFREGIKNFRG